MTIKPETSSLSAHSAAHGGIVPGSLRYRVEHLVEAAPLQLFILVLVLVDIMAVALEVTRQSLSPVALISPYKIDEGAPGPSGGRSSWSSSSWSSWTLSRAS